MRSGRPARFLNRVRYAVGRYRTIIVNEYDLKQKLIELFVLLFNTLLTGGLIWYAVEYKNPLSYGITAGLLVYYFKFVVSTIKLKEKA